MGDVTISTYNLQFIPIAEDVISLENDTAFRDIWVVSLQEACGYVYTKMFNRMGMKPLSMIQPRHLQHSRSYMDYSRESWGRAILLP